MIKSISILGAGTSGFISALILKKKFPHLKIEIIKSEKIGVIGVGEGSTEHWKMFCNILGISLNEFILNCDATIKLGILFENWHNKSFLHSILDDFTQTNNNYYTKLGYLILKNKKLHYPHTLNNLLMRAQKKIDACGANQLHFDTFKLNKFLEKKSKEFGINVIVDDVIDAEFYENGNVSSLISKNKKYQSDIFIDCSGFNRFLLHKKMSVKWKSYSKYLPMNSAFAFLTEKMEDYNLWTKATAHSSGWSWSIPTQSKTGNGYVFCDDFISFDEAKNEMDNFYKQDLDIRKVFKFEPGRLEKFWHKNCISIGISGNFVEPLEATSIGSTIQQIRCLCDYLPSQDSKTYNKQMNEMFDNIVDFIQVHYLTQREDTPFWKFVKYDMEKTPSLNEKLCTWKNRLPRKNEIISSWNLFSAINFIYILNGLDFFDKENLKQEYEYYKNSLIEQDIENMLDVVDKSVKIKHVDYIHHLKKNLQYI